LSGTLVAVLVLLSASLLHAGRSFERRARLCERLADPSAPEPKARARSHEGLRMASAALLGWIVARIPGAVLGVAIVIAIDRWQQRPRRVTAIVYQERFADSVTAISSAVRVGLSLPQAILHATEEAQEPVRGEFRSLVGELDVGIPLETAIASWSERVGGADAELVAGAIDLHRRSGGDLPSVLDQVAATIRERVAVTREVRSLTAQARLSGWILGALPIGFFCFLWLTAREDMQGALATPVGAVCVVLGLVLESLAFLWIRSLLRIA
jgi:tight adherence protein B